MTLSYTTGLTIGSLLAYMMDACLGPPVRIKDVCHILPKIPITTAFSNVTTTVLTTVISSTLPIIEKTTTMPKLKTTSSILTTVLTSTLFSNNTVSLTNSGSIDISTTALPKILANVTSSVSNAILPH